MRYDILTGLSQGQLAEVAARVTARIGDVVRTGGRPAAIGLFRSVALVAHLMHRNPVQEVAGATFGVSQSTVSRRWDLLRPVIGDVLAEFVPDPREVAAGSSVLTDGTVCPTWDWKAIPDLYSAKAGYPGMNIQVAATLSGKIAAIGPEPVHGARHDAYAFEASGLKDLLAGIHAVGDLGYVGVDGIEVTPIKRQPGRDLDESQTTFNTQFSKIRAANERAVAHLKTWRMLSEEGGRYRPPISKYQSMLRAVIGLIFFTAYE